jgi:NAD(P)-dependent dehydrogenase (short-subunit alcohol dehydrogenase family)
MSPIKPLVLIVTGSDSGFGLLTARALAQAGHVVYGGLFKPNDGTYPIYADLAKFSTEHNCNLHGMYLNIVEDDSIAKAISAVIKEQGRIDGIVHNAGHMSLGPAEAFTPEQFLDLYDTNCVGCHRLNRAVLPHMRAQRSGLLVWVSSSSAHGPSSPYLSAYFAAKAAQDSLAQTTALEVSQFGIETSIVTPGIFTKGTNHFCSAMKPADQAIAREYSEGLMKGWQEHCLDGSGKMGRLDIQPQAVADSIVKIVGMEHGKRPWRSHVEPEGLMAERVNEVRDKVRREYLSRMGCADLMTVRVDTAK